MLLNFNFDSINGEIIENKIVETTEYQPVVGNVLTFRDHFIDIGLPELNQDFEIYFISTTIKDNNEIEQTINVRVYQNPAT